MRDTDRPTALVADCGHVNRHYHGTLTAYKTCACRCAECTEARRRYDRQYKGKTGRSMNSRGESWEVGSAEWLTTMRWGLYHAVRESFDRHGRVPS